MHLLAAQPGGFVDDASVITRMGQTPAEIVILSAADTTLALLAAECPQARAVPGYPQVRLANLLFLRQPASVDLYVDEVLRHARLIIIDHLGGESYWPYGTEQVCELAAARGIALVMFSGDNVEDELLLRKSTVPRALCQRLWRYLREGGAANARAFYDQIGASFFALPLHAPEPLALPLAGVFHPDGGADPLARWVSRWQACAQVRAPAAAPRVAVVFYRAHWQAGNTQVFEALCEALLAQGLNPLPVALASLKAPECVSVLAALCRQHAVSLILNTTSFAQAALDDPGGHALVDDIPVVQVMLSGSSEDTWRSDPHGLQPRDIAMHVAMPEVDGRIISRAVSFKGLDHRCPHTQVDVVRYRAEPGRLAFVCELARRWCRLRGLAAADKRLALVMANYPAREGRLGNGVGLDTPASVLAILQHLKAEGYAVEALPEDSETLMRALREGVTNDPAHWAWRPARQSLALADYRAYFDTLPQACREALLARWGAPEADPMLRRGRFMIAGLRCGKVFVGIQPARGYELDVLASYHDPDLVPPHHYLAFYVWLRTVFACDAIVHVGKHGNLEWLPGKSVALSEACWPEAVFGPMPHLYPFIVNDPGEGTQAKRRAQAVIVDHLMPPLTRAENYGPTRDLERLVDEYYEALTFDRARADLLRGQILDKVLANGLHSDLGLAQPRTPEEEQALLNRTDAYLCELKESQIRDGLHVFGHSPEGTLETDTLLALARFPVGDGRGARNSLIRALAADLALGEDFDPLDADWACPWHGPRPEVLCTVAAEPWRHAGDTRERLELFAASLLRNGLPPLPETPGAAQASWPATRAVLGRIDSVLRPALRACGPQELLQLARGLAGRFVPAGPSGAPSRGRPDVLPTGRNFYSIDTRAVPTPTSWTLGLKSARLIVDKYVQTHGEYPRAVGLSIWGTATMRTGGDDMAQAFALIGVRPKWAAGSHRVADFEILPMAVLGRPRIDVTLRVSGFFRDAFGNLIDLFDAAVQKVAGIDEADEPDEVNPIRGRIRQEAAQRIAAGQDAASARRDAGFRVFGARPGAYGAGLQGLIDSCAWDDDADLALAYRNWGGHAYGQGTYGAQRPELFSQRLAGIDLVMHNQDNREHDLLDSDDYYQFQGGMTAAVRHYSGRQPEVFFGDHANPQSPRVHTLAHELSRVVRARVTNPKWIAGVKRHGYKGAAEIAATVDYLFAFDATARVVRDDQYARVADAFVDDAATRQFMQQHNPDAFRELCARLLEAMQRGLWQSPGAYRERIEQRLLEAEELAEAGTAPARPQKESEI